MEFDSHDSTYFLGIGIGLLFAFIFKNLSILSFVGIILIVRGVVGFVATYIEGRTTHK